MISQSYMDEVVLPFLCKNKCKHQAQSTSRQNQQKIFQPNNVVRIDWPVLSSDMFTIEQVKDIFGQMAA